jgi:hypothetical protein
MRDDRKKIQRWYVVLGRLHGVPSTASYPRWTSSEITRPPPRVKSRWGWLWLGATALLAAGSGDLLGRGSAPPLAPAAPAMQPPLPDAVTILPEAARSYGLGTVERRPLVRTIRVTGSVGFNASKLAPPQPLALGRAGHRGGDR